VLGAALAGLWFRHQSAGHQNEGPLSPATRQMLGQLESPVTIQYYSLLPAGSASGTLKDFAGRVDQLLDAAQAVAGDKLKITRITELSDANNTAAGEAGIRAFNLDKGEACFLGLTLAGGQQKETLAQLQPEWENALEFDLARAILRVGALPPPPKVSPAIAKPSTETLTTIQRLIPNVETVSVEQADLIFHTDFVKACAEVGSDGEAQIKVAQDQAIQAEAGGNAADLEAARKHLMKVQIEQANRLKQLAVQLQVNLAVFKQMKAGTNFNQ
jgi:hypothetical protein